jgi:hypothetical protein
LNNASEETSSDSHGEGGDDEVYEEEDKGEEDKKNKGKLTPPRDPINEDKASRKRNGSPMKPSLRKNSKDSKPKLDTILRVNDINLIIIIVEDKS